jgi:hypothetical protein
MRAGIVPALAMLDSETRTPVTRAQRIGPNRSRRLELVVAGAEAIAVANSGIASGTSFLRENDLNAAVVVHSLMDGCDGSQGLWVASFTEIGRIAIPSVQAKDVAPLLDKARKSRCGRTLDALNAMRVELLQAINDRDAANMARLGTASLASPLPKEVERERSYYVLAAMTGLIASGRREDALALAQEHWQRMEPRDRDSLAMRLLLGHAGRR